MKKIIVTTSWDDGHILDLRLAELMRKYGIQGTFYVSPHEREFKAKDLLGDENIKQLSKHFEIGSHTMTHPHLSQISLKEAEWEIKTSKKYLEKLLNKKIISFCYPYGDYNQAVSEIVKKQGYKIARTVKKYDIYANKDVFQIGTTLETHRISLPLIIQELKALNEISNNNFALTMQLLNWEKLAIRLFDKTVEEGGIYHLWGHSWVIEKYNGWNKLEKVFQYISNHKNVVFTTNGEAYK